MSENQKIGQENYYEDQDRIGRFLSQKRNHAVLKHIKGHLVDLGCGDGQLVRAYEGQSTGVDIEDYGTADVVLENFNSLPFEDQSIDTITIIASLNYFEDPVKVLSETNRILKDDGQLIITMPNAFIMKIWHSIREGWAHHSGYSKKELEELFNKAGLKLVKRHPFLAGLNFVYEIRKA